MMMTWMVSWKLETGRQSLAWIGYMGRDFAWNQQVVDPWGILVFRMEDAMSVAV